MHATGNGFLTRALTLWTAWVQRHASAVISIFVLLTVASIWLTVTRMEFDSDPYNLISSDVAWHKAEKAYAKEFPNLQQTVVAVIDGDTPERTENALHQLMAGLQGRPEFKRVWSVGTGDFFARNALLYLEPAQLEELSSTLEAAQPFLGKISSDPSLAGLFGLLNLALQHSGNDLPFDITAVTTPIIKSLNASSEGRSAPLSWQSLVAGDMKLTDDDKRYLIIKLADVSQDRAAVTLIRNTAQSLGLTPEHGVRVRLTGEVAMWIDESDAAFDGSIYSIFISLFISTLFLYIGLRSGQLVAISMTALLVGLALTTGAAVLVVGRLNLISVAFATLYIAVSIDYSVQFAMRYRELMASGKSSHDALAETGGQFGEALILCAVATSIGFFAFVPTDYRGVAELGLIAGMGIIIGALTCLSLLIALIEKWPTPHRPLPTFPNIPGLASIMNLPMTHTKAVRIAALVITLIGLFSLQWIRFDYNSMNLRPKHTESLQLFEEMAVSRETPMTAVMLLPSLTEADAMAKRLSALPEVREVRTLSSFVPSDQSEKRDTLDALSLSLGMTLPASLELSPVNLARDLASMRALRDHARSFNGSDATKAAMTALADALDGTLRAFDALPKDTQQQRMTQLRDAMLGSMPALLHRLQQSLSPQDVTLDNLPTDIRELWVSASGQYKVEAFPKEALYNNQPALFKFTRAIETITPQAAGMPFADVGSSQTVIHAFLQAFGSAFVLISLVLLLVLRSFTDALRAMTPLIMGSVLLGLFCVVVDQPFNMANVIVLPLLLGIGVDIGIVILWRARHGGATNINPVMTATGAAVLISMLTTLIDLSSLMLSTHRGMFSMGLLLTVGLLLYLVCTFLVLPSILTRAKSGAESS